MKDGSPRLSPREPSKDRNNININIDVSNIMNPAFLLGIAFNIVSKPPQDIIKGYIIKPQFDII